MSATRNLGLKRARGKFISWLDGDDVWLPDKLERQVAQLIENPDAAMAYGPLHVWYGWTGRREDVARDFIQPLGLSAEQLVQPPTLLRRFLENELYTPSGVMIRREILERVGGYDERFNGMHEDGIVHTKVCLRWPVYASSQPLYRYRQHPDSCCNRAIAAGKDREALYNFLVWVDDFLRSEGVQDRTLRRMVRRLLGKARAERRRAGGPVGNVRATLLRRAREAADRVIPARVRSWVGLAAYGRRGRPPTGWLHWGNLRRVEPISGIFGFDRSGPVDRYYIEQFLRQHSRDVRGAVLEVGDRAYTRRFGGDSVTTSDVLHERPGNPEATLIGDLCTGEGIPTATYDCIILTQVLPFVWDFRSAIETVRRALKPGGVVLATVPGISQISRFDADAWGDFWRFTSGSAGRLFAESFGRSQIQTQVWGNVLAATAFLHGIGAGELEPAELDFRDPDYEMTIGVRAVRVEEE